MMRPKIACLLAAIFVTLTLHAATAPRRLIYTGWDSPTAAQFRQTLAEFEKQKIFNGATIVPTRRVADEIVPSSRAFSTNHWNWSEFSECVADLSAARPQHCTNNFLILLANPGDVGWFDDKGWTEVIDHWRLLARVARKGGLTGIVFDPEPYDRPWSQFKYLAQLDHPPRTFSEMKAKARERGRAVMTAVAEEFPDATLFAYRLYSDLLRARTSGDRDLQSQTSVYGLLPAFVDGWFDAAPPGITIIDGNETAYFYESPDQYFEKFARLKTHALEFVSPENHAKFRNQFHVSHGIYLDAYAPEPNAKMRLHLNGETPASRLMRFGSAAFEAADGLVWIYGERAKFWPTGIEPKFWPEKFQGIEAALRASKNPAEFARELTAAAAPQSNLLRDSSFAQSPTNAPGAWSPWLEADSKGAVLFTNGIAQFSGAENAAATQSMPVHAGEMYAASIQVKATGRSEVGIAIGWQDDKANWTAADQRIEFGPAGVPDPEGWRNISGLVRVPSQASRLVFLIFARGQAAESRASFKDPRLLRASDELKAAPSAPPKPNPQGP